jgi:hypothetical protein
MTAELYQRLTGAQRHCIALFLDLYLACGTEEFSEQGPIYFTRNSDYWRRSSLQLA